MQVDRASNPLPSWRDGHERQAILDFVRYVVDPASPGYVRVPERIATFDNDGTLWSEQPFYAQFAFALDRIKALAPKHPEWRSRQPFKAVLEDNYRALQSAGERAVVELMMAGHAATTSEEFDAAVRDWMRTARHPRFRRRYTDLIFEPMRELIDYLNMNHFKVYIVSGGGIEFLRAWTEEIYGIPPERVIGSSIKTRYEMRMGRPVLARIHEVDFIDDGAGKPVGIHKFIGRRPIFAAGNSDGDLEMLQWCSASPNKSLCLVVHHTDKRREFAYDRNSTVGKLERVLDVAPHEGWIVIDMKKTWKRVYPFDE
jgi:phosphoserine phosphatase